MKTQKQLPLEWATTDEIMAELTRRTTAFVLVYQQPAPGCPEQNQYPVIWHGGVPNAYGLVCHARQELYRGLQAISRMSNEE